MRSDRRNRVRELERARVSTPTTIVVGMTAAQAAEAYAEAIRSSGPAVAAEHLTSTDCARLAEAYALTLIPNDADDSEGLLTRGKGRDSSQRYATESPRASEVNK